jgi:DNA-binding CsgD family transcriptional regulator
MRDVALAELDGGSVDLREVVVQVDRVRGRLGADDSERALEVWRALLEGQRMLVDSFDRDGRRFVVLRKCAATSSPSGLSRRERQVVELVGLGHSNKLISSALGISEGSVSSLLSSAAHKLGVRSRVELVQLAAFALALVRSVTEPERSEEG